MERIAIFLRQSETQNFFREVISRCVSESSLDDLYICSGFFQERKNFSASSELGHHLHSSKSITVVGIYNGLWRSQFDDFVSSLHKISRAKGLPLTINKRRTKGYRWHAKIFIACSGKTPVLAIVGSSNITRPAFGNTKPWNYEADVVLWDAQSSADSLMRDVFSDPKSSNEDLSDDLHDQSVIVTSYDSEDPLNSGLSLKERINYLLDELLIESDEI